MSEGEAALDESGEQPDAMETLAEICKHAEVAISFVASLTTNTTSEMEDAVGGEGVMLPLVLMAVSLVFAVRGGRLIRPACVVAAAAIGFWVVWDMLHMFVGMAQVSEPSRSRSRSRSCSPSRSPGPSPSHSPNPSPSPSHIPSPNPNPVAQGNENAEGLPCEARLIGGTAVGRAAGPSNTSPNPNTNPDPDRNRSPNPGQADLGRRGLLRHEGEP